MKSFNFTPASMIQQMTEILKTGAVQDVSKKILAFRRQILSASRYSKMEDSNEADRKLAHKIVYGMTFSISPAFFEYPEQMAKLATEIAVVADSMVKDIIVNYMDEDDQIPSEVINSVLQNLEFKMEYDQ